MLLNLQTTSKLTPNHIIVIGCADAWDKVCYTEVMHQRVHRVWCR